MAEVNTTETVSASTVSETEIKNELKRVAALMKKEKKKTVSIPKQLQATLGDTLPACINGVCVNVPVDGEEYEVPAPYAELIRNSLKTINSGDVRATLEQGVNEDFLADAVK